MTKTTRNVAIMAAIALVAIFIGYALAFITNGVRKNDSGVPSMKGAENSVPGATNTLSLLPSVRTVASGDALSFSIAVPQNTASAQVFFSCPDGVAVLNADSTDLCNAWTSIAPNQSQLNVIPSFAGSRAASMTASLYATDYSGTRTGTTTEISFLPDLEAATPQGIAPLTVLYPRGGETFSQGDSMNITWNAPFKGFLAEVYLVDALKQNTEWELFQTSAGMKGPNLIPWNTTDGVSIGTVPFGTIPIPSGKYFIKVCPQPADQNAFSPSTGCAKSLDSFTIVTVQPTDSDNSPDYSKVFPSDITPERYPDLFVRGVGTGVYAGSSDPTASWIYGSNPDDPTYVVPIDGTMSIYYDNCGSETQLNEAFIEPGTHLLSAAGISAPPGYICYRGAFVKK